MSKKESKKKQKMHYFKLIHKNEPVRPNELKTKYKVDRVRYDFIDELCYDKQIEREKYTEKYTLLFMPGHKKLADEKFNDEIFKNRQVNFKNQKQKKEIYIEPEVVCIKNIDKAIGKLIEESNEMPEKEDVIIEVGDNIDNAQIMISKRLKWLLKLKFQIEKVVVKLYGKEMPADKMKKANKRDGLKAVSDEMEVKLPSDEEILNLLKENKQIDEMDFDNPSVRCLIRLCKENFKKKNVILA